VAARHQFGLDQIGRVKQSGSTGPPEREVRE